MNICSIIGILLLFLICYIVYVNNNSILPKYKKENWADIELDSYSPKYDSLYYSGLDMDKAKKTEFSNGFKLEDNNTQCLCECKTKKKCKNESTPTPTSMIQQDNSAMGYRINYYPWFIPYEHTPVPSSPSSSSSSSPSLPSP
jgi:hypothetical protein